MRGIPLIVVRCDLTNHAFQPFVNCWFIFFHAFPRKTSLNLKLIMKLLKSTKINFYLNVKVKYKTEEQLDRQNLLFLARLSMAMDWNWKKYDLKWKTLQIFFGALTYKFRNDVVLGSVPSSSTTHSGDFFIFGQRKEQGDKFRRIRRSDQLQNLLNSKKLVIKFTLDYQH